MRAACRVVACKSVHRARIPPRLLRCALPGCPASRLEKILKMQNPTARRVAAAALEGWEAAQRSAGFLRIRVSLESGFG